MPDKEFMSDKMPSSKPDDWYSALFENSPLPMWIYDAEDGRILAANHAASRRYGYTQQEFLAMHAGDLVPGMTLAEPPSPAPAGPLPGLADLGIRQQPRKDGGSLYAALFLRDLPFQGHPAKCLMALETGAAAAAEVGRQQQLLAAILDTLPLNIYLKNPIGELVLLNEHAAQTLGRSKEELIGKTAQDVLPPEIAEAVSQSDAAVQQTGGQLHIEEHITHEAEPRTLLAGKKMLQEAGEQPFLLSYSIDITERKQFERQARQLANYDPLTNLPNRNLLNDRLAQAVAHAHRFGRQVAVLFINIDRFKLVNDSLGHEQGDALLKIMAGRLQKALPEGDTLARLAGDDFAATLLDIESEERVTATAQGLLQAIAQPVQLESHELVISASIGISLYPRDGLTPHALLKNADIAMSQCKSVGGNHFRFYAKDMNARVFERLLLETDLRRALVKDEFVLHYQPKVALDSGRIVGMEALIRWQHPTRGLLYPAKFIPVAEEIGIIGALGKWVLARACAQTQQWRAEGLGDFTMSVNLSARQLASQNLLRTIRSVLDETGLPARQLELEITESSLMDNIEMAAATLTRLSEMGVHLSIDDFGTGYSSLNYLKRLPIDTLKVDQSFIRDVSSDPDDAIIVQATIAMAQNMNLRVVAEGVMTVAQLDFLALHHCDEIQGFYFSKPLPADDIEQLLREDRRLAMPHRVPNDAPRPWC